MNNEQISGSNDPISDPFNKVYEEFKTYPDLKIATEDLRIFGQGCLKLRTKFEI